MISIFNNKATKEQLINYNGDFILDSVCIDYKIKEELNGNFTITAKMAVVPFADPRIYELIKEDSLLKATDEYGFEYFRICSVRKNKKTIELVGRQVTISETLNMWCEDVRPTKLNGAGAIDWIFNNCTTNNVLTVSSNIPKVSTAYYINKNVYEALFDSDMSFIKRWGGEVFRRGFRMAINERIGQDKGVSIRSRKNLLGLEIKSDNKIATRIYPTGFDGITIKEKFIDSSLINNYSRPYTMTYHFEDIRVNNDDFKEGFATLDEAQTELKKRVKYLYEVEKVDQIKATYQVDFVELGKTEEYKNYSMLESVDIGDYVNVYEENLNINVKVRVISREYNGKLGRRTKTVLTNNSDLPNPTSIKDVINNLKDNISETGKNVLQAAKIHATDLINAGLKDSYVIVRPNEVLIMDTKDINTARKVWRWNNGGLGYSNTGYYGTYGTAITQNGAIVADFITAGIINADLIKAGTINGDLIRAGKIRNKYDTFELDLESQSGGVTFNQGGFPAISLIGQSLKFYDWHNPTAQTEVGALESTYIKSNNASGISLSSSKDGYLAIGHTAVNNPNEVTAIIRIDRQNILSKSDSFLELLSNTDIGGYTFHFKNGIASLYTSSSNEDLCIRTKKGLIFTGSNGVYFYYNEREEKCIFYNNVNFDKNVRVNGSLNVYGQKNCVQSTKSYGDVCFYSVEDCESYLTDRSAILNKVNPLTRSIKIELNPVFKESVDTEGEYIIEIIKQSWGDYRIKEQTSSYFIVESDRSDFSFKWVVSAKRKGYETVRNEVINSTKNKKNIIKPSIE